MSALDPLDFIERCRRAAAPAGFRCETFGEVAGCPLIALTRRTAGVRPRIYLSSGIHGDEPAPPEALLSLLQSGLFDGRATWFLTPLLNPAGFLRRTRENADTIDLNRDYRAARSAEIRAHIGWLEAQPPFDVALSLHEDWEAGGVYLYELNPDHRPSLAAAMLTAAAEHLPIDPNSIIDGRSIAEPGIIRPEHDPALREDWPETIYLRAHHTRLAYTLETPSGAPLADRVRALAAAVAAAVEFIAGPRLPPPAPSEPRG